MHNKRAFCPLLALIHPHSAHNVLEKERLYLDLPQTHLTYCRIGSERQQLKQANVTISPQ